MGSTSTVFVPAERIIIKGASRRRLPQYLHERCQAESLLRHRSVEQTEVKNIHAGIRFRHITVALTVAGGK